MDAKEAKKRIMDFMEANMLTVISTVDANINKPESAVIAFAQKDNFELKTQLPMKKEFLGYAIYILRAF